MKLTTRIVAMISCLAFVVAIAGHAHAKSKSMGGYVQTNLISDIPGLAPVTDPNLLNPWGLAFFPDMSPFWINENNQPVGASALYFADAVPFPGLPSVTIPAPTVTNPVTPGAPTGIVANFFVGTGAFDIPDPDNPIAVEDFGGFDGAALFIFDTEDGTIEAWTSEPFVSPGVPNPLVAEIVVDNSDNGSPTGAVYKGLTLGSNPADPLLYATNFRSGKVEVYDTSFTLVNLSGSFTDPKVQNGYAPFGIQNIGGQIWVTYAKQDAPKHDPVNKPGHGFVSVFDQNGNLLHHFAQHGHLDSPWGVAMAPASFGQFGNDMLIGNFGDGVINVFDPSNGHWLGMLPGPNGHPLVNSGLWSLTFGGALKSDGTASSTGTLFFSAGLNDENDGLFGTIVPAP